MIRTRSIAAALAVLLSYFLNASAQCASAADAQRITRASSPVSLNLFIRSLGNQSADVRINALKALTSMGPSAADAVPAIVNCLTENRSGLIGGSFAHRYSPEVTSAAVDALGAIGPAAKPASPYLVQLLDDRNELFRRDKVLAALARTGLDDSATKTIMKVVQQEGKFTPTRNNAIKLLGIIDPPATDSIELLSQIAEDTKDPTGRTAALASLSSIKRRAGETGRTEDVQTKAALYAGLDSVRKEDRLDSLHKIADMGSEASYMVPRLIRAGADGDKEVVHAAIVALGAVGKPAASALPWLVSKYFSETNPDERDTIGNAITSIDESGRKTIPMLQPALEDPFKARLAIKLLESLGTDDAGILAQRTRSRWHMK